MLKVAQQQVKVLLSYSIDTFANGDILGVAFDADNGKIYFLRMVLLVKAKTQQELARSTQYLQG